ncbi:nuclear transport factor 2 family protein [Nocardia miyunensis]|uniref:nuclear transport factor 2 family protein n=1 Tax=Nocardia miyunensis TaxID=282684 RepID=UPI0008319440|nr:nuclear transport factor 2 family protein [Nocardia miyunensis]
MTTAQSVHETNRIVRRVLTDGQYVVNHSLVTGDSGPTAVRFDLWRIDTGEIVEHWADEEPWAPETANGHTQIDGVQAIDQSKDTEATRGVATATVQAILVGGDVSKVDEYLAESYVQHNPRFADGSSGLLAALGALAAQGITMKYDGIEQVVAEGDFAYVRSEGAFGGEPYIFHDLFRVADGRCAEHWDVMVPRQ